MKKLPTRAFRVVGTLFLVGLLLLVGAVSIRIEILQALALVMFGGSAFALALFDLHQMLVTRSGFGRLSGHVSKEKSPKSFTLHIALLIVLAGLWAALFFVGVLWLLS